MCLIICVYDLNLPKLIPLLSSTDKQTLFLHYKLIIHDKVKFCGPYFKLSM
jgi:hypothetical protein